MHMLAVREDDSRVHSIETRKEMPSSLQTVSARHCILANLIVCHWLEDHLLTAESLTYIYIRFN